jgi:SAM-dependent methyltransferase
LELGGRDGGLSLWLAHKNMHVICSDVDDNRARAEQYHQKHAFPGSIEYAVIDALDIPYENQFDLIAFKSVLGGVGRDGRKDRQQQAVDQMYKALKPGGQLLFMENLVASPLHSFVRRKFVRWGNSWRYVTLTEMREFLSKFKNVRMGTTGVLGTFGRTERQRDALARVDQALLNRLTPARWQYLVFGIAEK